MFQGRGSTTTHRGFRLRTFARQSPSANVHHSSRAEEIRRSEKMPLVTDVLGEAHRVPLHGPAWVLQSYWPFALTLVFIVSTLLLGVLYMKQRMTLQKLFKILDLTHELHAVVGFEGRYHALNHNAWFRATGYSKQELYDQPVGVYVHPDDREVTLKVIETLRKGVACARWENRWVAKDGSIRYFEWCCSPDLKTNRVFSVGRDITAQKQILRDLDIKRQQAEASAQSKSEFLANISHEVRVFLTRLFLFGGGGESSRLVSCLPVSGWHGMGDGWLDTHTDERRARHG